MLQITGSKKRAAESGALARLHTGDSAIIEGIDLPGPDARRLMELGFLPGTRVTVGRSAPGGDPRIFHVDGSEIAIRRETAMRIQIRPIGSMFGHQL